MLVTEKIVRTVLSVYQRSVKIAESRAAFLCPVGRANFISTQRLRIGGRALNLCGSNVYHCEKNSKEAFAESNGNMSIDHTQVYFIRWL